MSAALLAAYAIVLAGYAAPALARARWVSRAPRLGIAAWQALTASLLGSVVLAALVMTVPAVPVNTSPAGAFDACVMMLAASYATPYGAGIATAGLAFAVSVSGRAVWSVSAALARASRTRRHHRDQLALLARYDTACRAWVVDHAMPAAYCLSGRGGRIAITTGALAALSPSQLRAVLAHERAHLRQRHHLAVTVARGIEKAFGNLAVFRTARRRTQHLAELAADDAARKSAGHLALAEALINLASPGTQPAAAPVLAASGQATEARVRRLLEPHQPIARGRVIAGLVLSVAALALPLAIALGPLTASGMDCCPPA